MPDLMPKTMTDKDRANLRTAVGKLESLGFGMKAANALGTPIERAIESLPAKGRALVQEATKRALDACLKIALSSFGKGRSGPGGTDVTFAEIFQVQASFKLAIRAFA